jgi:Zn-dependent protease
LSNWQQTIYLVIGLLIGVVFHEYMHGRIADWRGDHTARNAGRLTLNPVPHIDLFGTVLLPIGLLLISRGTTTFGYAKPVPVNPYFMKKRHDMVLVALAGPATNFSIALVFALLGMVLNLAGLSTTIVSGGDLLISPVFVFIFTVCYINIWLGIFNLIPIPPLDGSHVLEYFLSNEARVTYERLAPYGFVVLFLFFFVLARPLQLVLNPILNLVAKIMGIPLVLV